MTANEYFRGERGDYWPLGAVYIDKGYVDPQYYLARLKVGECSMTIDRETAVDLYQAMSKALDALEGKEEAHTVSDVYAKAFEIWDAKVVEDWMQGPNSYLEGSRPIDFLRLGRIEDVWEALDLERV